MLDEVCFSLAETGVILVAVDVAVVRTIIQERRISVPKAARLLDLPGVEVSRLIFEGEIDAVPTLHEGVRVSVASLERWLAERQNGSSPATSRQWSWPLVDLSGPKYCGRLVDGALLGVVSPSLV